MKQPLSCIYLLGWSLTTGCKTIFYKHYLLICLPIWEYVVYLIHSAGLLNLAVVELRSFSTHMVSLWYVMLSRILYQIFLYASYRFNWTSKLNISHMYFLITEGICKHPTLFKMQFGIICYTFISVMDVTYTSSLFLNICQEQLKWNTCNFLLTINENKQYY